MQTTATQAIESLIVDYSKLVFHVIYGLTGQWEESQDLTQETFLNALRGIDAARAKAGPGFQPKPWLMKIAINTVHMAQRRQRKWRFILFADLQPGPEENKDVTSVSEEMAEPGDMETVIAERDVVNRCLHQLPATLCTPLLLSIVAGFSSAEIARLLDLKEATVRQRLVRARRSFQRLYAHECGEHLALGGTVSRSPSPVSRSRDHRMHRPAALVLVSL